MPLVVQNLPASTGDIRNGGSIPGLGRSPRKGMATRSSWKISWTEESGGLQSMGPQRVRHSLGVKQISLRHMARPHPVSRRPEENTLRFPKEGIPPQHCLQTQAETSSLP